MHVWATLALAFGFLGVLAGGAGVILVGLPSGVRNMFAALLAVSIAAMVSGITLFVFAAARTDRDLD